MNMVKISLRNKLLVAVFLVIFIVGIIVTIVLFEFTQNNLIENEKISLKLEVRERTHSLYQVLRVGTMTVEAIATRKEVVDYLENGNRVTQDKNTLMHLMHSNLGNNFSAIYVMDVNGLTWTSTNESFVGRNYAFRDYFKKAMEGNKWTDVSIGVTSKELGFYFSQAIKSEEGNIIGVAVAKIKPEYIAQSVIEPDLKEGLKIMLVDEDGVIIFSNIEDRIYKSLGKLTKEEIKAIEIKRRYEGVSLEPWQYEIALKELINIEESKALQFYDEGGDEEEILAIAKVKNYPFFIIIEEGAGAFTRQASNIPIITSVAVLVATLFTFVFITLMIARFLKPLRVLGAATTEISRGNLNERVQIKTGDEFESLGDSFNLMADRLQKTIQSIEERVEERTAELEKINKTMIGRELKMIELKNKLKNKEDTK